VDAHWFEEQLEDALAAVKAGDYVRATAIADQLAMEAPEHPLVRAIRAQALLHISGADEALSEAQRAVELNPPDPQGHLILGYAAWRLQRLMLAETAFASAVRFSDRAPRYLAEYAWFLASARAPKPAEQAAQNALAADANSATAWAALGMAQFRMHRRAEAEESLRRALTLNPQDVAAQSAMVLLLQEQGRNVQAEILADRLEAHPGTEELVETVRQQAKHRRLAARLIARRLPVESAPAGNFRRLWIGVLLTAAVVGGMLFLAFPGEPLLILLCVTIPLALGAFFYWLLC
jgi:Flp pilus assembly protein TadD